MAEEQGGQALCQYSPEHKLVAPARRSSDVPEDERKERESMVISTSPEVRSGDASQEVDDAVALRSLRIAAITATAPTYTPRAPVLTANTSPVPVDPTYTSYADPISSFSTDPNANRPTGYPNQWIKDSSHTAQCGECTTKIESHSAVCANCKDSDYAGRICEDCFDNGRRIAGLMKNLEGCWCRFPAKKDPTYHEREQYFHKMAEQLKNLRLQQHPSRASKLAPRQLLIPLKRCDAPADLLAALDAAAASADTTAAGGVHVELTAVPRMPILVSISSNVPDRQPHGVQSHVSAGKEPKDVQMADAPDDEEEDEHADGEVEGLEDEADANVE